MERKQKKQKKAEYFAKRHTAIKRQVEQQRNFDRQRKKQNQRPFQNNSQSQNKRQAKEQKKRSDFEDDFDLFKADDNEEITSEESFVPEEKSSNLKQSKPIIQNQEVQPAPKAKKSVKFAASMNSDEEEEEKEIKRLERLLGIKDNPGKAQRLKKKLDTEMGLGEEFMNFLDDIEHITENKTVANDYTHKRRKFEEDSSAENQSENEDQQEFDEDENVQQEGEDQSDEIEEQKDEINEEEIEDEDEGEMEEESEGDSEDDKEQNINLEENNETHNISSCLNKQIIDKALENEVAIEKEIRAELNKLSDGNMDIIFKNLNEKIMKYSRYPETLGRIYFKVFKSFCIDIQMINSAILSVTIIVFA